MNQTPPNWYSDPANRHELRYWDGTQWTDHVITNQIQSIDQLYPATAGMADLNMGSTSQSFNTVQPLTPQNSAPQTQASDISMQIGAQSSPDQTRFGSSQSVHEPDVAHLPAHSTVTAPTGDWYPDPTQRHELRYWDGVQWTNHVISNQTQWLDPLFPDAIQNTALHIGAPVATPFQSSAGSSNSLDSSPRRSDEPVTSKDESRSKTSQRDRKAAQKESTTENPQDSKPKPKKKFVRQVKSAGVTHSKWRGGGTLTTESVLIINQKPTRFDFITEYTIFDRAGQELGKAREAGTSGFLSLNSSSTRAMQIEIRDTQGDVIYKLDRPTKIMKSKVDLCDAEGQLLGTFAQNSLLSREITLEHSQGAVGTLMPKDIQYHNFEIKDAAGKNIASITRTWAGRRAEKKTRADNYVLEINEPMLPEPALGFVITAPVVVDILFQQDKPSAEDTKREREARGFWF